MSLVYRLNTGVIFDIVAKSVCHILGPQNASSKTEINVVCKFCFLHNTYIL